jgi:competence protein ComEC
MTAVFLIAILFDRRALSLRNVAIAALIVLAGAPEAVLHPGFQMSFAAVTALIAWHEWQSAREDPARSFTWPARAMRYAKGLAATDIAASVATSAYSLYHFHRAANFGLPANMVSMPLMAFVVMPAAIVALLLMPFGLDGPVWRVAAVGVDAMLKLGAWTSSAPWAVTHLPQWPSAAMVVLTAGGLLLCLGVGPWRLSGLVALPCAVMMIGAATPPRIFIADDGENAAFVVDTPEGRRLAMMNARRDGFSARAWMEAAGLDAETLKPLKLSDHARCDDSGCVIEIDGRRIAVSISPFGVDDDCLRADLVIALHRMSWRAKEACRAEIYDIWKARDGDGAIGAIVNGEIRIRTVAQARGARAWSGGPASNPVERAGIDRGAAIAKPSSGKGESAEMRPLIGR